MILDYILGLQVALLLLTDLKTFTLYLLRFIMAWYRQNSLVSLLHRVRDGHIRPTWRIETDCNSSLFVCFKGERLLMMQLVLSRGESTPTTLPLDNFEYPAIIAQLTTSLIQRRYAPPKYYMLPQIRTIRSIRCYVALYGKIPHTLRKSHDRTMTHVSRISKRCINEITSLWLAGIMFKYKNPKTLEPPQLCLNIQGRRTS
jgi:hypothetical protein